MIIDPGAGPPYFLVKHSCNTIAALRIVAGDYYYYYYQGRSQKFFFGRGGIKIFRGGGIKLLNSRSDVIFTP